MLRLYIIRHGTTNWNTEQRLQGHTDVPLSPEGIEQARRAAARLAGEPLSAVWSSDLCRAQRTAEIIAEPHGLPVTATPLLRESMLGAWEGLTAAEIQARGDGELFERYRLDSVAHRPPESEALQDVWERLIGVQRQIMEQNPEGQVAIVGHGGSARVLLAHALCGSLATVQRINLDNASLSIVEYNGPRVRVRLLNDTSHLK